MGFLGRYSIVGDQIQQVSWNMCFLDMEKG